jgi:hypothetical protein
LSGLGRVHEAKNRVGGSRNRISMNEARETKVDSPVWAPIVAAASVKSASTP